MSKPVSLTPDVYFARSQDLLSPTFHNKRIAICGVGAGSGSGPALSRMGVGELVLFDFDQVEFENLSRTSYVVEDVGLLKVDALARHIKAANPFVTVRPLACDLMAIDDGELSQILYGMDLIVAGTDSFPVQAKLNIISQRLSIPCLFIGIHEKGAGGRIVFSVPGETPCYRCVSPDRYAAFGREGRQATDIPGARGLLVDSQFVDTVALKIAVSILERHTDSPLARFFQGIKHRTEVIVRTTPEYGFGQVLWDAILSDLPQEPKDYKGELEEQVLYAMDTVWLQTTVLPGCPDCQETLLSKEGAQRREY